MALSSIHGYPRIGARRELKRATEAYWAGDAPVEQLHDAARAIRRQNWESMRDAGIDLIPSGDFSYYDQVLDVAAMVGAVPQRFAPPDPESGGEVDLDTYFAMARGRQSGGVDAPAMEMTKWFDTNYHYIVPELDPETELSLRSSKPFDEYSEAKSLGIETKPVLVGPVTWLLLAKPAPGVHESFDRLELLDPLLAVYAQVLARLGELGAEWVELQEPAFACDRTEPELDALWDAYKQIGAAEGRPKLCVTTYFDHGGDALPALRELPIEGVGLDFHRGPRNLALLRAVQGLDGKALFAGVVDGRNVWACDLEHSLGLLDELRDLCSELVVSTSCPLQHVPIDLALDGGLDSELRGWLAFARQKLDEVATLARGLEDHEAVTEELARSHAQQAARAGSKRTRSPGVRERVVAIDEDDARRQSPYAARRKAQRARLSLPVLPTTTVGSFPQTADVRGARASLASGEIDEDEYERRIRAEIERVVRLQEQIGLDVLVHGEAERNDMVRYFGERMEGFAFSEDGWVQSYGSRYVRPPIVYGDVSRPEPITVRWIAYAQSLTELPVKGMLTAPVTMLRWSFVRDDQPEDETCRQIALAIRDEVEDLERAGVAIIQIDDPAFREGLPLRREGWDDYFYWAVLSFRLAASGVRDETQIQTHMCYSEFGDILEQIQQLDADVLLIEAARSRMELLGDWARTGYDKEVGPGVYDIHSPRVPSAEEIAGLLRAAAEVLAPDQLWVTPDCGLKTRRYEEVEPALRNMVQAARQLGEELEPAGV